MSASILLLNKYLYHWIWRKAFLPYYYLKPEGNVLYLMMKWILSCRCISCKSIK
jgi:hypothetical protein